MQRVYGMMLALVMLVLTATLVSAQTVTYSKTYLYNGTCTSDKLYALSAHKVSSHANSGPDVRR
jgi:hypothetical protein